jgi:hypothetical protein
MTRDRHPPGRKAEIVTMADDKLMARHMGGEGVL